MNAPDTATGKRAKCPRCGQMITVPSPPVATILPPIPVAAQAAIPVAQPLAGKAEPLDQLDVIPSKSPRRPVDDDERDAPRSSRRFRRDEPDHAPASSGAVHSLGIASVILGVVSLPIAMIPCLGFIGLPLSGLGLLLGVVGGVVSLTRHGRGIGFPIAGTGISGLAALFGIFWLFLLGAVTSKPTERSDRTDRESRSIGKDSGSKDETGSATKDKDTKQPGGNGPERAQGGVESARGGDVEVRVTGANFEVMDLVGEKKVKVLAVRINITNTSGTRKIDYRGWGYDLAFDDKRSVKITDNFGNSYRLKRIIGTRLGQVQSTTSILPGRSLDDVLLVEETLPNAEYFDLDLPVATVGEKDGTLRFRIPATMIAK
jgi:hypothetical protein